MRFQKPDPLFDCRGLQQIVAVEQHDAFRAGFPESGVACSRKTAILCMVDDTNSGIEVAIRSKHPQSFRVITAVVNDEPFPLLKGLPRYRLHRLMKDLSRVVKGSNYGHLNSIAVLQRDVVE